MKQTKTTYERPTTDLLVIRFEQNIMSIPGGVSSSGFGDAPNADVEDLSNESWW